MKVTLEATLAPSEDPKKVLEAMRRVVTQTSLPANQNDQVIRLVSEEASCLRGLRDQLRDRHIRSAAKRLLLTASSGDSTSLMLNRQAAAAGVVALCSSPEQSPLGPLRLTIDSARIEAVIDWLTAYESG